MSSSVKTKGFVLPMHAQRALRYWQGARSDSDPSLLPENVNPINLSLGDPAFVTAEHIRDHAKAAIDAGATHYAKNHPVKWAIAEKLRAENSVRVDNPRTGVVMTPGSHAALYQVMSAYVAPGDEVLMGDPGSYFHSNTILNGGTPVLVPLRYDRGFRLDPEDVAQRITPRTKILCLTSPDAPTGAVHERDDLQGLAELARRHDLLVVSDEVYEYINFGSVPHTSIASLSDMAERTITVNGFSKGWAMTGWRIGYAAGLEELMAPVNAINHLNLISINSISQWAALSALEGPRDFVVRSIEVYRKRMETLVELLDGIDGIRGRFPDGTYYCWTNVSERVASVKDFSLFAWRHYGLRALHGTAFGPGGEGYLRLSCSLEPDDLREGVARLSNAIEEYSKRQ